MTGWRVAPVTDGMYEQHAGAQELRLELARDERAPGAARTAIEGWCPPELSGGAPRRETLVLLVSEVVTNAVLHSPGSPEGPIELTARIEEELIRVMVTDPGDGFTPPEPPAPHQLQIGGYGLYVVGRAARRWGVERDGGTRVWVEI
jgi:anti-sigma regulatory factor (Ser/Thr protein kinase)